MKGSRPYPFKFFKGCLPQVLLGPFLNALSHIKQLFAYLIWRNYRRQRDHPRKAMKLWRKPLEILILSVNYTFHFCFRFSWAVFHIISNRQAYYSFYVLWIDERLGWQRSQPWIEYAMNLQKTRSEFFLKKTIPSLMVIQKSIYGHYC